MRKIFSLFAALTLSVGLWAINNVPYIDANGQLQYANNVTGVISSTDPVTLNAGWYVVMPGSSEKQTGTLVCQGEVHLIVCDGAKLTATGADNKPGIEVSGEGNSLTIYGYTNQSGQLIAIGGEYGAGIGGENFRSGSNITINGGIVEATGGKYGAGIGGGNSGSGENITINGGVVTATGGYSAAGIGGGDDGSGSNITINGGIVEATGGEYAAGIGGGDDGSGSNITINGGEVTATGGNQGAGIGGGDDGSGSNITINGGVVTANGASGAAGIGGGDSGSGSNIYISDAYVLKAGSAANPTDIIAHSSAADLGSTLTQQYVKMEGLATPYTRSMTIDNWATVCLPYDATSLSGADFYKINYYDGVDKLYIEEVTSLVAGMPYIFQATAETVTINPDGAATLTYGEEGNERGLYGSLARTIIESDGNQAALSNGSVIIAEEGAKVTVPACRAYFDMSSVPATEQPHAAPLRCIGVPRQTPTGLGQWNKGNGQRTMKVLENGQFRIVRDGKEYNAQGQMIQ